MRLIITATDRDHGIKIEGYDINQELKKGDPTIDRIHRRQGRHV